VGERDRDSVEHTEEIDIERVDERHLVVSLHRQDACVAADHVEVAELGQRGVDNGAELIALAHVGLPRDDATVERLDGRDGLGKVCVRTLRVVDGLDLCTESIAMMSAPSSARRSRGCGPAPVRHR